MYLSMFYWNKTECNDAFWTNKCALVSPRGFAWITMKTYRSSFFLTTVMRHHSGQNVEESRGGPLRWRILFDIRIHTTLNPNQFVFHHNVNVKENVFLFSFDQDRDTKKEQAWNITFPISLVYCPKWAFLIGYYYKKQRCHKDSASSEATTKLNVYSQKYNFICSVTANVEAEI